MSALPSLSRESTTHLKAFHAAATPQKTTHLNLSDPGHRSLVETMLSAAGRDDKLYPHLYGALNKGGAFKGDPSLDRVDLVDGGKTASGATTVSVVSASSGDTMVKGGSLLVFDSDTGELLGHGANSSVRNGFLHVSVDPQSAKPAGKKLSVLYLGHATDGDGSTRFYSFAHEVQVGDGQGITVNITDPAIRYSGNKYIWIAVGRLQGYKPPVNTDYWYIETQDNEVNPYLIVPFNANVALSGSINFPALTVNNFNTCIYVNDGKGGTVVTSRATQYTTDSYLVSSFKQGGAPNVMQWNFAYDQASYANTKSLVYNPTTGGLGNQTDSFFYFQFQNIPLVGGGVAPPFYVCSDDTPGQHSLNCTKVRNIYFWWSCLAKGTLVTLEDGTQRPIEDIDVSFRVKTPQGGMAVVGTVRGYHQSSASPSGRHEVYRLVTANGKTITATATHMLFLAPNKCRAICYVAAGDPILTEDGPSTIKSVEPIDYEGTFYGLAVGNPEELAQKKFPADMASYFAGGVLHGDQLCMRHHVREAHEDLEFMLPRINQQLHRDYTSALQQKRY